jgi:hypothetical protein
MPPVPTTTRSTSSRVARSSRAFDADSTSAHGQVEPGGRAGIPRQRHDQRTELAGLASSSSAWWPVARATQRTASPRPSRDVDGLAPDRAA